MSNETNTTESTESLAVSLADAAHKHWLATRKRHEGYYDADDVAPTLLGGPLGDAAALYIETRKADHNLFKPTGSPRGRRLVSLVSKAIEANQKAYRQKLEAEQEVYWQELAAALG